MGSQNIPMFGIELVVVLGLLGIGFEALKVGSMNVLGVSLGSF